MSIKIKNENTSSKKYYFLDAKKIVAADGSSSSNCSFQRNVSENKNLINNNNPNRNVDTMKRSFKIKKTLAAGNSTGGHTLPVISQINCNLNQMGDLKSGNRLLSVANYKNIQLCDDNKIQKQLTNPPLSYSSVAKVTRKLDGVSMIPVKDTKSWSQYRVRNVYPSLRNYYEPKRELTTTAANTTALKLPPI